MQVVGRRGRSQVGPQRLDDGIAMHAVALDESQQFHQRARLAEPPDTWWHGRAVNLHVESAQQRDANLLWRHALSVSRGGGR